MKNAILSLLFAVPLILVLNGCSNKGPELKNEENLVISTNAVNNAEILGADYNFDLTIESKMPPSGVIISVNVVGESDNRNYSPIPDFETSNKVSTIRLHDLPLQIYCLCTVRATSKSGGSNTAVRSFRVIRK